MVELRPGALHAITQTHQAISYIVIGIILAVRR